MTSHAQSSFNSRYPLHVQIEMKNPNLQRTLLYVQKRCGNALPHQNEVWERRSHTTTPLKVARTLRQGLQNFLSEGRTLQVMRLFQDMLHSDKSTNVY